MKNIQRTLLAIVLAAASTAFAGDGIAFITNIKGEISVDGNARPALLSELGRGQKIVVGRNSEASVMYIQSGKEYVLPGPADYTVKDNEVQGSVAMPPRTRETAWRASNKVLAQVAQTSAASVRMRSIAAPKVEANPMAVYPAEGNVSTLHPTFRWHAEEGKAPTEFTLMVVGQDKPVHAVKAVAGASVRVVGWTTW